MYWSVVVNTFTLLHNQSPELFLSCKTETIPVKQQLYILSFSLTPGKHHSTLSLNWKYLSHLISSIIQWYHQFSSVQSLSHVRLFVTPRTAAHQASLSITNFQSLLKLMSTESVMPSNHLILSQPLLLLPSILPSNRVFSNESVLHIRWLKYWSFSFSISPFNEYSGLI